MHGGYPSPRGVPRWERLIALAFGAAVLVASQLPTIWAWRAQRLQYYPDKVFTGAMSTYADDAATYWSWMDQGREGRFFFTDRFTSEDHPRNYVNVLFWGLGNVSRVTGLDVVTVYNLSRPLLGAMLLCLLYCLTTRLFERPGERLLCFFLLVLSGGWEGLFNFLELNLGFVHVPSPQWWTPELNTFYSLLLFPHFLAGFCCMVAALLLMLSAWSESERRASARAGCAVSAGGVLFFLTFFHPYDVVSVVGALCGAPFLFAVYRGKTLRRDLALSGLALAVWLPSLAYNYWLFRNNPAMRAWDLQNNMVTPEPPALLMALGIGFPLALLSFLAIRRMNRAMLLMWVWLVTILVAIHLPVRFQRRMIGGIQFPLAVLSTAFLFLVVVPWLARRVGPLRDRVPIPRAVGAGAFAVGALFIPVQWATPYYVEGLEWGALRAVRYPSWLDTDVVSTLRALATTGRPESIVVSSYETGNFIPFYTGHRTVLGHYALTIESGRRTEEIARFYSGGTGDDSWRIEMLQNWKASYVLLGPHERALGPFDPSSRPWLRRLFVSGEGRETETAVYEVVLETAGSP